MQIKVHSMVADQKAVLALPQNERRAAILRMLAPFEPALKHVTPPGVDAITAFGFLRPDGPVAAYGDALTRLEAVGAEQTCKEALDRARDAIAATGYQAPLR